ncbi:hypothetical protein LMG26411_01445 [Cupriavidus numazuensis]|uniref:Lipoprotein n=1 Tax=Cupriavidus numazuensis TaxID=221992 RepID=A0ABM8TDP5_9BURK|nr:hypothetical protein LMG26411_01445 [Cupriavidus numazuensis]
MKTILVLLATSVALLSGCVVAPDHDGYRDGYYHGDGRVDHDRGHWDHDRGDHRDYGDRDHWQGGPRY